VRLSAMSIYLATKAWVDDNVKTVCKQLSIPSNCNETSIVIYEAIVPKFLEGTYCRKKSSCNICSVKNDSFCLEASNPPVYFFKNEKTMNNVAFKGARQFAMEDDCIAKFAGMFFISELLDCGALEQLNAKIGCNNFSLELNTIYCGPVEAIRYAPDCQEINGQMEYIYVKEKIQVILKKII